MKRSILNGALCLVLCLLLAVCAAGCRGENGNGAGDTEPSPGGDTTASKTGTTAAPETTSVYATIPEMFESDGTVLEIDGVKYTVAQSKVWATGDVNMRSGPGTEYGIVKVLHKDEETERISTGENGWSRCATESGVVYVSSQYLTETDPAAATAATGIVHKGGATVIAIDAGHQSGGMSETEPNGPGSTVMKAKVTSGTAGCVTRIAEHVLNLDVALRLRDELIKRGYTVVMIRESADVRVSNAERAQIANNAGADVFVRIHANGATDSAARGAMTICQTPKNPYNASSYAESRALSDAVLNSFCTATGVSKRSVWETDTMTGINWCNVPATIVEMGFMSNPDEDRLMATDDFRRKAATGIADGIEAYLKIKK